MASIPEGIRSLVEKGKKSGLWYVIAGLITLCAIAFLAVQYGGDCNIGKPDRGPQQATAKTPRQQAAENLKAAQTAQAAPKPAGCVGVVVSGPQIVTGSGVTGYAVYVEELQSVVPLYAKHCPQLGRGHRVVMIKEDLFSDWYTFVRFE